MKPKRMVFVAVLAAAGLLAAADPAAAPPVQGSGFAVPGSRHAGAAPAHRGYDRPSHPGGPRPGPGGHVSGWNGGSHGHSNWGWGVGLALAYGVPWTLGWHDPFWWGTTVYAPYAYGPAYGSYGPACAWGEDCMQERFARTEPDPPTTEVAPAAPGEEGGPTQRPLHLNYCESARAWFPHVRTCPGGWRLVIPDYGAAR